jgi:hypothetical protein
MSRDFPILETGKLVTKIIPIWVPNWGWVHGDSPTFLGIEMDADRQEI